MSRIHDAQGAGSGEKAERRVLVLATGEVDPFRSLAFHRLGQRSAGTGRRRDHFDEVFHAPHGPARVTLDAHAEGVAVAIESRAEDLEALCASAPALVGLEDAGHASFEPSAASDPRRVLRDARVRVRGLRLVRAPWLYELMALIVLQQRVAHEDAMRSYRWLVREQGTPYSAEQRQLRLFPAPLALSRLAPEAFREAGIDRERAERLRTVGRVARHLGRLASTTYAEARAFLSRVPGLGPWSIEHFLGSGLGDADAAPTGDYWYPHTVALALAGEPRADDQRMLELLEPLRPHRYRALLWLAAAGVKPVRYGPRMKPSGPPR